MISGEDFFKVFIQGLKNMLAQLLATVAAALVLAVILAALPLGLAGVNLQSIGTAFKHFSGPMMGVPSFGLAGGLGGAMQDGVQVFVDYQEVTYLSLVRRQIGNDQDIHLDNGIKTIQ